MSQEVKVDRTQATEFGNRLKQVEQKLNSLHTSMMQDAIMMPRRNASNVQVQCCMSYAALYYIYFLYFGTRSTSFVGRSPENFYTW